MQDFVQRFLVEARTILLDRDHELSMGLCCFLAGGHLLIEDAPGVGKTTLVKILARLLGLDFKRVQFTNDLLPSDILGSLVFDSGAQSFKFHRGPIFAQLVLGDELNRASPRTQSATLQAMEEREVTIEGGVQKLPVPFFFVGTQNPRDHVGTSPLPESQMDRFLMRIELGATGRETQRKLLLREKEKSGGELQDFSQLQPLLGTAEFLSLQKRVATVGVTPAVSEYMLDLMECCARNAWVVSPRAILGLQRAAQSWAMMQGRDYTLPDDVQTVFVQVFSHRLAFFAKSVGSSGEGVRMAQTVLAETKVR